jgi:hypothetical protein
MSTDWKQIERDILQRIDIASELTALGLRFSASEPNASGWMECHAFDREDSKPSAAVCIASGNGTLGQYTDRASGEKPLSFWELTARLGAGADWKAAREHFAAKANVELPTPGRPKGTSKAAIEIAKLSKSEQLVKTYAAVAKWPETGWNKEALLLAKPRAGHFFGAQVFAIPCYRLGEWDKPTAWKLRRFDSKPFKKGKAHCHGSSAGSVMLFGTPEQLAAATDVVVFEGESDPLCWAHLLPAGYIAIAIAGGADSTPKNLEALKGKRVCIVGHRDTPGQKGKNKLGRSLLDAGLTPDDISEIELPYPVVQSHGRDAKDFREAGKTWDDLAALIRPFIFGPIKPEIVVTTDREDVVNQAIDALATSPRVMQRGGMLAHIVHDSTPPKIIKRNGCAPRIVPLELPTLAEQLSTAADFVKIDYADGEEVTTPIHAPRWVVETLAARGQWPGIKPLIGVVETPTLRPDGTIISEPGYDEETGLFLAPSIKFPPCPENPSLTDARQAAAELLEVVCDFPFQENSHRAAWLAAALTPPAKFAIDGPTPLIAIDANTRGTGKTLCVDTIGMIYTGDKLPRTSAPATDEEMSKAILAIATAGEPMVLFDNQERPFGGPAIDAALTGTSWSGRILGFSKMSGRIPLHTQWFVSGNNLDLQADTARRTLHIYLETREENPENRTGFKHSNLPAWILDNRARLAVAAVTILRAFCLAGRQRVRGEPWGSFEAWSDLVRSAVAWLDMPNLGDPADTRTNLATESDQSANVLRMLLDGWSEADPNCVGMTARQALELLDEPVTTEYPDKFPKLRAAIDEITPIGKAPNTKSLGSKIRRMKGRISGGKRFVKAETQDNTVLWKVEKSRASSEQSQNNSQGVYLDSGVYSSSYAGEKINNSSEGDNYLTSQYISEPTKPTEPSKPRTACDHQHEREVLTPSGAKKIECAECGTHLDYKHLREKRQSAESEHYDAAFIDSA